MGIGELWRRIGFLLKRNRNSEELDEEMRLHAELRAAQLRAKGVSPEEATQAAQRQFGNRTALKEGSTDLWAFAAADEIGRDISFATRFLRKNPAFAVAAITSLALGIGANTAVFSLLNALALKPLPVEAPGQLSRIGSLENNGMTLPVPAPVLESLRKDPLLQGVCGFLAGDAIVEVNGDSAALATHSLSGDCYQTLGVRAALGRLFQRADDRPNGPKVAVLGYDFWQAKFAGNPDVLGRFIRMGGKSFQIIGVTEPRFRGLLWGYPPSVSAPISQTTTPSLKDPSGQFYWAEVLARRRPNVQQSELQAHLRVKWRRLLDGAFPASFEGASRKEMVSMPPVVTSGATGIDYYFRDHFQNSLVALLAVSMLVLLVSCINVANLLLARGWQRQREIAVRLAIGAGRGRIIRQLLAESVLLIAAGLGAAFVVSLIGIRLIVQAFTSAYARSDMSFAAHIDGHVLLFTALAATTALLVFGVLPAWQTSDVDSATALKTSSRSVTGGIATSRRLLLAGQMAMTLVILIAANIFADSLTYLKNDSLHFQGDSVLNIQLMPHPGANLDDGEKTVSYFRNLLGRIKECPGVGAVSLASFAPLVSLPYKEDIRRLDHPDRAPLQAPAEFVTEGFLGMMHIPLLQGRGFRPNETPKSPRLAIVSESVAKRLFAGSNALGQHIQFGTEPETRNVEIVGVAADVRLEDPHTRDQGFILLNFWQLPRSGNWGNIQVRFSGKQDLITKALHAAVQKAGRQQIFLLRTMSELREMSLLQERLLAATGRVYGVLALALAAVGLFGLLTFFVSRRESEISIRMALGAGRRHIALLVIKETAILLGFGVVAGLLFSFAAIRMVSTLLYGVSAVSIGPVVISLAILVVVAVAAALGPVYRASSIDPNIALRQE